MGQPISCPLGEFVKSLILSCNLLSCMSLTFVIKASLFTTILLSENMIGQQWSGKVLLVDDEEILLVLGAMMLESLGLKVLKACDGWEAIQVYKAHQSDVKCIYDPQQIWLNMVFFLFQD